MESEKVKEIKKVLEQNTKTCLLYDFEKNADCKVFQCKYILDYVNELESENKELNNELKRYKMDWLNSEKMHLQADMEDTEFELFCANKSLEEVRAENKQLKDRIYELEEGIAKSMLGCEFLPECTKEIAEKIWNMSKITVNATKHIVQGREYLHLDALKEIIKSCGVEIKE